MTTTPGLVGYWKMDEGGGTQARDMSGWGNNATLVGSPTWIPVSNGLAIDFNGSTSYARVSDQAGLDVTTGLTLSAWIKPRAQTSQDLIGRAIAGSSDGYELSLSSAGTVFMRLNQASFGDTYRLDSLTHYPFSGTKWMHVAATYNGTTMRIYINGVFEGSITGPTAIAANLLNVGIGAQSDGTRRFNGNMDDVRIYNRALSASEIATLFSVSPAVADLSITKSDSVSSVIPGQSITYSIQASNLGPNDVSSATVADVISSKLTAATWTCAVSGGASCTASGSGDISDAVNLPVGGSVTYTLHATVASGASGTLTNTATIQAPSVTDPVSSNNSATDNDAILIPPQITTPPANVTVTAPAAANFSVVATGTAPLSYQWRRNGAPIAGATSASYVLNPTAGADSGASFDVVVTNVAGTITSASATLTVNVLPEHHDTARERDSDRPGGSQLLGRRRGHGTAVLPVAPQRRRHQRRDQRQLRAQSDGRYGQRCAVHRRRVQCRRQRHQCGRHADGQRDAQHHDTAGQRDGHGPRRGQLLRRRRRHRTLVVPVAAQRHRPSVAPPAPATC